MIESGTLEFPDNQMTPEQIVAAWAAMAPSGDRERVEALITAIEAAVGDMIGQMAYLSNCDEWDEGKTANNSELEYVQRELKDTHDAEYILARCAELRQILNRIMPPSA